MIIIGLLTDVTEHVTFKGNCYKRIAYLRKVITEGEENLVSSLRNA
jgi:hypothetical protein